MRCLSPKTVGFYSDGKTICWSPKKYSKEFAPFQIPCGKCIACRLENARQTAVRCVHEAQMYEKNSFITLTYSEENLRSEKLQYVDFQKFIKDLRTQRFQELLNQMFPNLPQKEQRTLWNQLPKERRNGIYDRIRISVYVAGEYGDRKKRPHWHAIIFNWRPDDCTYKYSNDRGDQIYSSATLEKAWPYGLCEIGSVTIESAGYCARYAAKKLAHGRDGEHDYEPISRRSTRHAIGKKWLEKYWPDVFNHGYVMIRTSQRKYVKCGIPRYYEKWFKKNHPEKWEYYIKNVKSKVMKEAREKEEKITLEEKREDFRRSAIMGLEFKPGLKKRQSEKIILEQKFEGLQKHTKL